MLPATSRIMTAARKRVVLVLAVTLPVSAWIFMAGAMPASACSDSNSSNHCYAQATNFNSNTNHGVAGQINFHCLYQPNNGNFATQEIWDASSAGTYWEETGIISGVDPNSNYDTKDWFWADSRPNGGNFHFHLANIKANSDTTYPAQITFVGNQTWDLYGGNSFVLLGQSINQSSTLTIDIGGTEYLGGSGSGIRDVGNIYTLQRESTNNNWLNWGSGAGNGDLGPGNYINGSYDTDTSHESWNGPC
jgi:hypothetical protein